MKIREASPPFRRDGPSFPGDAEAIMKIREALAEGAGVLASGHSGSPNLDASLLLAFSACITRSRLLSMLSEEIQADVYGHFFELVKRRNAGESVAYIVGYREFYGRDFFVDARVLVPRPETELLIETALGRLPPAAPGRLLRCHDAFTGSGCIGITLACERPDLYMELSDISEEALAVCSRNAGTLCESRVQIKPGDVLSAASGSYDLITANPPYVGSALTDGIFAGGSREPRLALDGGTDGLMLYGRLATEAFSLLVDGGWLLAEIGDEQGIRVAGFFTNAGFCEVEVLKDLAGQDRVVAGVRK
jgi:release factor glutamine methyltransferase